ncbi:MAG: hypothetical protein Fur0010_04820 [Bdellovibrio sp.]
MINVASGLKSENSFKPLLRAIKITATYIHEVNILFDNEPEVADLLNEPEYLSLDKKRVINKTTVDSRRGALLIIICFSTPIFKPLIVH